MATKLTIKNFGPIKEAELDLRKTTVFIGPQGSGKSVLAKLIAVFRIIEIKHEIKESALKSYCKDYNIHNFFKKKTCFHLYNTLSQLKIDFSNNIITDRTQQTEENKELEIKLSMYTETLKALLKKLPEKEKKPAEDRVRELLLEYEVTIEQRSPFYTPTERLLIAAIDDSLFSLVHNQIPLPKCITGFGHNFEIARKEISTFHSDILDVVYKFENGQNRVYLNDNQSYLLSESASGYQSVLPLQVVIEHYSKEEKQLFIVEEPELNLYPATQKKLIYYLAKKCPKLVISTHSPYTLVALNNLLFAYKVTKEYPEVTEQVAAIIPQDSWLNPDEFSAYYVTEQGTVESIVDAKTGLIGDNALDGIADDLGDDFEGIFNLRRAARKQKKNA